MNYARIRELLGHINELAGNDTIGLTIASAVDELKTLTAPQTAYDADAGVYYEPFIEDGRVGYRVASNRPGMGLETFVYLNPSDGSDDGVPTVFVYQGIENDPALDGSECYIVPDGVGYQEGEEPVEGAKSNMQPGSPAASRPKAGR